jgi:hypothetical protein
MLDSVPTLKKRQWRFGTRLSKYGEENRGENGNKYEQFDEGKGETSRFVKRLRAGASHNIDFFFGVVREGSTVQVLCIILVRLSRSGLGSTLN